MTRLITFVFILLFYCNNSANLTTCTSDDSCPAGEICLNGSCQPAPDASQTDIPDVDISPDIPEDIAADTGPDTRPACEVGTVRCKEESTVEREICADNGGTIEWQAADACTELEKCDEGECECKVDCTEGGKKCEGKDIIICRQADDEDCPYYEAFLECDQAAILGTSATCHSASQYAYCAGNEFRVNEFSTNSQMLGAIARDYGDFTYPLIQKVKDGRFVIAWTDHTGNSKSYLKIFNQTGGAVSSEVLINSDSNLSSTRPVAAATLAGEIVVIWNTGIDNKWFHLRRFDSQGSPISSEAVIPIPAGYGCSAHQHPNIQRFQNGEFLVTLGCFNSPAYQIYAYRMNSEGTLIENSFTTLVSVGEVNYDHSHFQVIPLPDSGFFITWNHIYVPDIIEDLNRNVIYYQRFASNMSSLGEKIELDRSKSYEIEIGPMITAPRITGPYATYQADGTFAIGWWKVFNEGAQNSYYQLTLQRFKSDAVKIGSEILVSSNSLSTSSNNFAAVSMAYLKDSRIVVLWNIDEVLRLRVIKANGDFLTSEIQISEARLKPMILPGMGVIELTNFQNAALNNHLFIAWNQWGDAVELTDVYGQIMYLPE